MSLTRKNALYMMRAALNITQQAAADRAGLSLRTVMNAEKEPCSDKTWRALLSVYEQAGLSLNFIDDERAAIMFDADRQLVDDVRALIAVELPGVDLELIDKARDKENRGNNRGSYPADS